MIDQLVRCSACDKILLDIVGESGPLKAKVACSCGDYSFIIKYSQLYLAGFTKTYEENGTLIIIP